MDEGQNKRVLALLFVGVLMGALDLAIVGPALPAIQADCRVSIKTATSASCSPFLLMGLCSGETASNTRS